MVLVSLCFSFLARRRSEVKVAQSCLTLCDPMDYTVHGILQARILEWVAVPLSRRGGLSNPGIEPRSPALQADSLSAEPPGKPQKMRCCVYSSPDTAKSSMTHCNVMRGGPVITTYSSTQACPGIRPPETTQKGGKAEGLKVNSDHPIANLRRVVNSTWWKNHIKAHITCELHVSLY